MGAMFEIYMGLVKWPGALKNPGPDERQDVTKYEALLEQDHFVRAGATYVALSTGHVAAYPADQIPLYFGDSVMVFKGAHHPKVLRPRSTQDQTIPEYEVINDCRLHPLLMGDDATYIDFWRANGSKQTTVAII